MTDPVTPPATPQPGYSPWQLMRYMLGLGTWGFGGPVALVGYMYRDLVEKRHWITEGDYKEGLALAQLMPGPPSPGSCSIRWPARRDRSRAGSRPCARDARRSATGVSTMSTTRPPSIALLYPGDRAQRDRADPAESRFAALFDAFAAAGVPAEPAVYDDDFGDEVAAQLRRVDAVLVWCNPIERGRRRDRLDALLREVSDQGVFVSTHPDTILKLGTKDVLVDVRDLPFGSDALRVDSPEQLAAELPGRLRAGPRVLKQFRGHSGVGVWRVERIDGSSRLRVRHAQRGSEEEVTDLPGLLERLAPYFAPENGGHMIDQAWQPRLVDGMVRAYLVEDRVTGFGHQGVNALYPARSGEPALQPGPRIYHPADLPQFQSLRRRLESQWVEMLRQRVGVPRAALPMLWDCDFMFGEPTTEEPERYVLCEINVSSVSPFPPSSIAPLVAAVTARLAARSG